MQVAVQQICTDALRLVGQLNAPGRAPATEETTECVNFLNRTLDGWSAMEERIFTTSIDRYPLTLAQNVYTIGPSGADITAPRPIAITNANIVLTSASPEVFIPLRIIDEDEFADLGVIDYATNIPTMMFYQKNAEGSANGRITLIGYPSQANDLQLYTWAGFPNTVSSLDSLLLPEGYIDAIVWTLAEKIAILYPIRMTPMYSEIKRMARAARATVVALNSQAPRQGTDFPSGPQQSTGPYFNFLSGLPA